jgi:CO/xanthine dehydrogenase FAD-binding subunit
MITRAAYTAGGPASLTSRRDGAKLFGVRAGRSAVPVARPQTLADAVAALAAMPGAQLLAGGTDFMVEVNFGQRRPDRIVALRRVADLRGWDASDGELVLRANLTYAEMERELPAVLPALAAAARTVGSPQIRNAGTLGGNLGTASPAGDTLPLLAALDGQVVLAGPAGTRTLPLAGFVTGVKRTAIQPGEVIAAVRLPRVEGPQQFLKVGARNAMVISIACCALVLDVTNRRVRIGLGSVAPRPLRPAEAEAHASAAVDWDALTADPAEVRRTAELAAAAAQPISDHRSTAAYRRHAVRVMVERALAWSLAA